MITTVTQVWRARRDSYRPAGEVFDPRAYEVVPIRRDALARLWTRARDRQLGEMKVSLPEVRVWLADGATRRAPQVITYELKLDAGTWQRVDLQQIPERGWHAVAEYVASGGLSADARVAGMVVHASNGRTEVFMRDGSVR